MKNSSGANVFVMNVPWKSHSNLAFRNVQFFIFHDEVLFILQMQTTKMKDER